MRTLILLSMVFSLSAFAQTRVKENIKQQAVATSEDSGSKIIKPSNGPKAQRPLK
jgi:CBS domain containing-hemolysin-like protein